MTVPGNKRRILNWLPAILWAGLIYYLSSQSGVHLPGGDFLFKDKVAHIFAYWVLCALVLFGCRGLKEIDFAMGVGLLIVIVYGFLDEIHQKSVPGRLCDPFDFIADSAGAVGCYMMILMIMEYRKRRSDEIPVTERDSRHTA